jgi:iron complex outermembrane receptor protein
MDGDMKVNVDDPGDMSNNTYNSSLKIDYGMGKVRFTSITSAVRADTSNDNDLDFTQYKLMKLETSKDSKIFSQEFRLNSEDNSPLKWRTGAYLYSSEEKQNIDMSMFTYNVVSSQYGKTEKSSAALFGQMDYKIGKFVLTAGLRYENEHQEFDYEWSGGAMVGYTPVKGSAEEDFTALLPKAALMYNINDNSQSYISIAKGFKSGGFNISSEPGKSYDSEYTWNYEVGIKNKLAGGKLVVNAAAFYIDWSDMQVEQPSYPDYIIDNAAEATSKGLELEARFLPAAWLNLYGSFGYVDAEFDDYTLNGVDYSGKKITNSPDTTYSLGGVLRFMDHWFVNAEINGTGKIYYNAANSKEQTSYEIINAKVGYETERFDVYVWVDNLLDQAYATRAFEMSGNWYGRSGNPLTVGANVNLRF